MPAFHLAQINIGRLNAPLDAPALADFVSQLDTINALADDAPGFVWRLTSDAGSATDIRPFEDDRMIVNFSVWEAIPELFEFTYRTAHAAVMARRREWFERMSEAVLVLWWIPAGHIPTIDEAKERLELLRTEGPTPAAFTFKTKFPPPVR
jgi:hypothetical protein